MSDCKHRKSALVPWFPGEVRGCLKCGEHLITVGHDESGIRMYYLPGDPPWRWRSSVCKYRWLRGDMDYQTLYQCPACCFVGTVENFDCAGGDDGELFCNQCGAAFIDGEDCESVCEAQPSLF